MILYHVTTSDKIDSILEHGLTPQIGPNSEFAHEDTPAVYLCDRESIAEWAIMLGKDRVLRVFDVNPHDLDMVTYSCGTEFVYYGSIDPSNIVEYKEAIPFEEGMKRLAKKTFEDLSFLTARITRSYDTGYVDPETLNDCCYGVLNGCAHVNFKCVSNPTQRKWLRDYADEGEYAFTDVYQNTTTRLWEQLILWDDPVTQEWRQRLHDFIQQNFRHLLYLDTGGYLT